jgi:DNA-binding CsgD family transcriptional regulator
MVARITGELDQVDIGEAAARAVLSSPSATPFPVLLANSGLALLATLRHDGVAARKQYLALESKRGTMLPPSVSVAADRLLGLLSATMGRLDLAMTLFQDARTLCRKGGYRPELAWTCYDYAEALIQRDGPGDYAKATSLLDESLSISSELGMRPLVERVVSLQGKVAQPGRGDSRIAPTYPVGLTQREVEVLRLIAAGKTDREIAEELFISVRTVGGHVSNILNKTNTSIRAEAATYAAHQGLV